ncbi:Uncharacterised protein [Klebsiella pneumoniae]|nr:Uncharacterised protein [Klebsiella pneumoniae]
MNILVNILYSYCINVINPFFIFKCEKLFYVSNIFTTFKLFICELILI